MIQYVLTEQSRNELLRIFPPSFPDVICHHITHKFNSSDVHDLPPAPSSVQVVGYAISDNVECLVVSINGKNKRPDGKLYHITHSIDRAVGATPKMSNDVLIGGFMKLESINIMASPEIVK